MLIRPSDDTFYYRFRSTWEFEEDRTLRDGRGPPQGCGDDGKPMNFRSLSAAAPMRRQADFPNQTRRDSHHNSFDSPEESDLPFPLLLNYPG